MNTNKYPEKDIPSDCHCVHCIENTKKHLTKKVQAKLLPKLRHKNKHNNNNN